MNFPSREHEVNGKSALKIVNNLESMLRCKFLLSMIKIIVQLV